MRQNTPYKKSKFLPLFIIFIVLLFVVFMIFNLFKTSNNADYKQIGSSIYSIYNNQIYASVPSNGNLLVPDADLTRFHPLNNDYQHKHIGLDKDHVFCGNHILPKLDPNKVQIVKDNYYTDNIIGYYCSARTIKNSEINVVEEIYQTFLYMFDLGKKPQTWIYPFHEITNLKTDHVQTKMKDVVVVDNVTYLDGQILPKANGEILKRIPRIYTDGQTRDSFIYTTDGQYVYADHELLPLKYNPELYSIVIDQQNQQEYLINPHDGMVYLKGVNFDRSHAPYHLISRYGAHADHSLFLSHDGIYYYQPQKKQIIRAGDNLFYNKDFKEIAPLVFSNGKEILFLQNRDVRRRKRGLEARITEVFRLDAPISSELKQIATVNYNYGSIWQNNNTYYYISNLGSTQLIRSTIYEIKDPAVISALKKVVNTSDIRKILKSDKISIPKSHVVLTAKTQYGNLFVRNIWYVLIAFFIIIYIPLSFKVLKNMKQLKDIKKQNNKSSAKESIYKSNLRKNNYKYNSRKK